MKDSTESFKIFINKLNVIFEFQVSIEILDRDTSIEILSKIYESFWY